MCGINGFNWDDTALVERMNAATRHRGPDDTGVWSGEGSSLGNNRLAIIDVSVAGHQPMKSADGRFVIVFNGEIYNYKELRCELPDYPFKSESDTEVLLAGFSRWGTGLFSRLNGIFAIAIWDRQESELFLARDRMGVKPLYVYRHNETVIFSSEIKAILERADVPRRLNHASLARYLRVGYTPGEETLFQGIEKVEPASYVRISGGGYAVQKYWEPSYENPLSGSEARTALVGTMDSAVQRQLVSDRPLGVFLSGGIDSSVILDCMSRVRSNIDTYSVGFEVAETENEKFNADFLLARKTAAHYGTNHHELMLGTRDLVSLFEDAIYHLDEPVGNATMLPQLALSRYAKETVSVVLGGDGGDELFGGYERYRTNLRMDAYARLPGAMRSLFDAWPALGKMNTPAGAARYALFHFIKDPVLGVAAPKFATDRLQKEAADKIASYRPLSSGDAFMRLDREWWLVDESLLRTDKMSMAAGVESRVPFLDNEMVALADRISIGQKVTNTTTKKILRDAFSQRLPSYLLDQPKRGWFSPGAKWLREPVFEAYAREVLSEGYSAATRDLFDWNAIRQVLSDHIEGRGYNMHVIWTLLSLQVWARTFKIAP